MVKTVMSSDNSEPEEPDIWVKTKGKILIQRSLIDSQVRTLQRLKESTSRLISTCSSCSNSSSGSLTNGESQSAIDDDIKLQENKLMKGFSNQLVEKHHYFKYSADEYEDCSVEKHQELDKLISLQQFLNVAGLHPETTKLLLEEEERLTLDLLFNMLNQDLEQLLTKHSIAITEGKKLLAALDLLTVYYEMWERGEKPSVSGVRGGNRLGSTSSSRLNSISNLALLDHDSPSDSISSSTSAGTSPLPLHFPTSTPLTPSSSQSLLSPSSPFTTALTSSTPHGGTFTPYHASATQVAVPVLTSPPPPTSSPAAAGGGGTGPSPQQQRRGLLNRSYSSSSNVLLNEPPPTSSSSRCLVRGHHSVSSLSNGRASQTTPTSSGGGMVNGEGYRLRRKPPLTHKRSLSNPLSNIVLNQDMKDKTPSPDHTQNSTHGGTSRSSLACYSYRSPSPPSRSGSQPSILSNTTETPSSSPQPSGRNPQLRKISNITPAFSQSISNDQLIPTISSSETMSGSESVLCRHGTWQGQDIDGLAATQRCNSMAGMSQHYSSSHQMQNGHSLDMTSSSMVDLPVGLYNGSGNSESLDMEREELGNLPHSSAKSQSVPRLTLMSVSMDTERGFLNNPSSSNPTSPHTPGTFTPTTRHMRHAIMHRFNTKTYITPHICDFCKKTVMMGVRCKDCKYKCHKGCAAKAPPTCGLPQELMNYFRKQVAMTSSMERLADQRVDSTSTERLADQRVDWVQSPSERSTPRPTIGRSNTYDLDTREPGFLIQDLASEPTNSKTLPSTVHYSPIMANKRPRAETTNGVIRRRELSSQSSSTSLLEVPSSSHLPRQYHSTSSSPTSTPPTSPSLTPSSPRSPMDYRHYNYVKEHDSDESYESGSLSSSTYNSFNDISDQSRVESGTPLGTRPAPQVILAKSLPDLLAISPTESNLDKSCSKFLEQQPPRDGRQLQRGGMVGVGSLKPATGRRVSVDSHGYHGNAKRKESLQLQRKVSTADSRASTLVASLPTEEDDGDSDSYVGSLEMGEDFNGDYKPGRSLVSSHTGSQDPGIPVSHTGSQDPGISVSHTVSQDPGISVSYTGSQDPGISVSHTGSQTSSDAQDLNNSINSTHLNLQHRNSVVDEWSIPFDHLRLQETMSRGRISSVYRGNWHGEVAIKHFLLDDAAQVLKFKEEVSILKKTRHENLVLFMGASLTPPNLAIVTMFCRGPTLYKCIHTWSEPFYWEKSIELAKQISQAMGYLHARNIVHKNLNTRNIFLENDKNKVVISDTGLSSLSDNFSILRNNLVIRRNKLYYLAPELHRALTLYPPSHHVDPPSHHVDPRLGLYPPSYESSHDVDPTRDMFAHSEETDIYAFGTVLYELIVRKFPLSVDQYGFSIHPSVLIYLLGSGYRPEMHTKEVPKRMQELIQNCWHLAPEKRLPFKTIQEALVKMSRKKTPITRSPSFPISLSKSTECLNFLNP